MGNRKRLERLYSQQYQRQQQVMQTGSQFKKAGVMDDKDETPNLPKTPVKPDSQLSHSSPLQVNKEGNTSIPEEKELSTDFKNLNSDAYKNYHQADINGEKWLVGKEGDAKAKGFAIGPDGKSYKFSNKDAVYKAINNGVSKPLNPMDKINQDPKLKAEYERQKSDPEASVLNLDALSKGYKIGGAVLGGALGDSGTQIADNAREQTLENIQKSAFNDFKENLITDREKALIELSRFVDQNPEYSRKGAKEYRDTLLGSYNKPVTNNEQVEMNKKIDGLLKIPDDKLNGDLAYAKRYFAAQRESGRALDQLDRYGPAGVSISTTKFNKLLLQQRFN